jgi:hypothetical protein
MANPVHNANNQWTDYLPNFVVAGYNRTAQLITRFFDDDLLPDGLPRQVRAAEIFAGLAHLQQLALIRNQPPADLQRTSYLPNFVVEGYNRATQLASRIFNMVTRREEPGPVERQQAPHNLVIDLGDEVNNNRPVPDGRRFPSH